MGENNFQDVLLKINNTLCSNITYPTNPFFEARKALFVNTFPLNIGKVTIKTCLFFFFFACILTRKYHFIRKNELRDANHFSEDFSFFLIILLNVPNTLCF